MESTAALSNEVRSLSQNLQKEVVWPGKSCGDDLWDLVAGHNPDVCGTAVWRSLSYKINASCFPRFCFECVVAFWSPGLVMVGTPLTGHQRSRESSYADVLSRSPVHVPLP